MALGAEPGDAAAAVLAERADDGTDTASVNTAFTPGAPTPGLWQLTPPTTRPTTAPPATGTWAVGTAYKPGDVVTYNGVSYRCLQAHTAIAGWEPPNVPALWARV